MSMTLKNALLAACIWAASAGAASAHAHLKSSVPAADASIAAPSEIRLTFNEAVEPGLSQVSVKPEKGAAVAAEKPVADPADAATLVVKLGAPLAPGSYQVDWKVISVDTHKMHGSFAFTVKP